MLSSKQTNMAMIWRQYEIYVQRVREFCQSVSGELVAGGDELARVTSWLG